MSGLDLRRFYIRAAALVLILTGVSAIRYSSDMTLGVITGGVLAIINIRQMYKGLRVLLSMDSPSAARLWFSGILRLGILGGIIILLAYMRTVNLLGLLVGFSVVPLLLLVEGFIHVRASRDDEDNDEDNGENNDSSSITDSSGQ